MRSVHADTFNHDEEADGYDDDVHDEAHPDPRRVPAPRWTGSWPGRPCGPADAVIDLGIGTANLAVRLPPCRRLVGVDVSAQMLELAAREAAAPATSSCVQPTSSSSWTGRRPFDAVVSTYAIHHLTADEKAVLCRAGAARLAPGGRSPSAT